MDGGRGTGGAGGPPGAPLLIVLGYANADLLARVPRLPGDGDRVTARRIDVAPGGMGANCAAAAGRLGAKVRFVGSVGTDAYGAMILRDLERCSVDVSGVARADRTTVAIVVVTDAGERTVLSEPTRYRPEAVVDAIEAAPEGAFGFYTDGYHLGWAQAELRRAKARGGYLYCDLDGAPDSYRPPRILAALDGIDTVQWTPKVASAIFPDLELEAAERALAEIVPTVITTRGGDPVRRWRGGDLRVVPVVTGGPVVDTTGAGDAFAGAFLRSRLAGADLDDAIASAVRYASASTRTPGARPARPDRPDA